jgi:hypothetical protein
MNRIRIDLVFSYWVYLWYLLYILKFTKYNPKFAIGIGIIDNLIMLCLMLYFGTKIQSIIMFIIINTIIKIIPYYTLRNTTLKIKDILFTLFLFILFIVWLHINKQSLKGNLKLIYFSLIYDKNKTPLMNLLQKIKNNYINL